MQTSTPDSRPLSWPDFPRSQIRFAQPIAARHLRLQCISRCSPREKASCKPPTFNGFACFFDGTSHSHCSFVIPSAPQASCSQIGLRQTLSGRPRLKGHDAVKASVPKLFSCPGAASSTPASQGSQKRVARWRLRKPTTSSALASFAVGSALPGFPFLRSPKP